MFRSADEPNLPRVIFYITTRGHRYSATTLSLPIQAQVFCVPTMIASALRRTAEDEEIAADRYYEAKQRQLERRLGGQRSSDSDSDYPPAAAAADRECDERHKRKKYRKEERHKHKKHDHKKDKRHRHESGDREPPRRTLAPPPPPPPPPPPLPERALRPPPPPAAPPDEDDYLERSRRRKEQLKAEARVPYIHGPQEDANPIIDYIIKSHKYKGSKARSGPSGASRADGDSLAQVLMDTRAHNTREDERQLDGAHRQLASRGHMLRPVLLTEKLSMVARDSDEEPRRPTTYDDLGRPVADEGGRDERYSSTQGLWQPAKEGEVRREPPRASLVRRWEHDRFDDGHAPRSRSRSRSRSPSYDRGEPRDGRGGRGASSPRGWCRGRSLSRSRSPDRGQQHQQQGPKPVQPGPAVYERPSPTYSPLRDDE